MSPLKPKIEFPYEPKVFSQGQLKDILLQFPLEDIPNVISLLLRSPIVTIGSHWGEDVFVDEFTTIPRVEVDTYSVHFSVGVPLDKQLAYAAFIEGLSGQLSSASYAVWRIFPEIRVDEYEERARFYARVAFVNKKNVVKRERNSDVK